MWHVVFMRSEKEERSSTAFLSYLIKRKEERSSDAVCRFNIPQMT